MAASILRISTMSRQSVGYRDLDYDRSAESASRRSPRVQGFGPSHRLALVLAYPIPYLLVRVVCLTSERNSSTSAFPANQRWSVSSSKSGDGDFTSIDAHAKLRRVNTALLSCRQFVSPFSEMA